MNSWVQTKMSPSRAELVFGQIRSSRCVLLLALALLVVPSSGFAGQQAGESPKVAGSAISREQYRQLVIAQQQAEFPTSKRNQPLPPVDLRGADEAFRAVLVAQARLAAWRQSQDRLAGWNEAVKSRIEAQSISAMDVEILAQAERRIVSEVARLESALRMAIGHANELAGLSREQTLTATVPELEPGTADSRELEEMEKGVLAAGLDILVRLFQSYSVGGISVSELLWNEQQVTASDTNYRLWSAQVGLDGAASVGP